MATLLIATLLLSFSSSPTYAQATGDYLRETPWLGVDRDQARPRGADDSTTGNVGTLQAAGLVFSPNSAIWENDTDWRAFELRNTGGMRTSQISVPVPSGFTMQNTCYILEPNETCAIHVRPLSSMGQTGTLRASATFGGDATATLTVIARSYRFPDLPNPCSDPVIDQYCPSTCRGQEANPGDRCVRYIFYIRNDCNSPTSNAYVRNCGYYHQRIPRVRAACTLPGSPYVTWLNGSLWRSNNYSVSACTTPHPEEVGERQGAGQNGCGLGCYPEYHDARLE